MNSLIDRVSSVLGVKASMLEREALLRYLDSELRRVTLEAKLIMTRYNVSSIKELDEKIRRGELSESNVFDDLTKLDYLLDREEKLRNLLKGLRGSKSGER